MGMFDKILKKLGIDKKKEEPKKASPATKKPKRDMAAELREKGEARAARARAKKEIPMVDVVSKLQEMANNNPEKLDWRVSIVDLLKLLDMDWKMDARIELARELGCPENYIGGDYANMNMWLHKEVLKQIAANGGNIPANLID